MVYENKIIKSVLNHLSDDLLNAEWRLRLTAQFLPYAGHCATAEQYAATFPYQFGRAVGFMNPKKVPSKRAQVVIDRVVGDIGIDVIRDIKTLNLKQYQNAL